MNYNIIFCTNENCKYFKIKNKGNLRVKQYQGKCQKIALIICDECHSTFSERNGTIYFGLKKPDDLFDRVIMMSMTRMSIKDICRVTGLNEKTVIDWIKRAANFLQPIHEKLLKNLDITECQIDEMWSFVLMKKKRVKIKGIKNDSNIADQWIFIAIDAIKKLVIHWKIGKRTLESAKMFINELKQKISSNPLYTTDELPAYEEAFLSNFSEEITPERTGKRGRPKKRPDRIINKELKLAQTHKHRKNGKVVKVTEHVVFGNKIEIEKIINESSVSNRINTSIVERTNGTIRAKVPRLVRQAYSFSKKLEMHQAHLTIYFVYYNLIWLHSRLKKTAAWMSNLVNKAFTFKELFNLRSPEFILEH